MSGWFVCLRCFLVGLNQKKKKLNRKSFISIDFRLHTFHCPKTENVFVLEIKLFSIYIIIMHAWHRTIYAWLLYRYSSWRHSVSIENSIKTKWKKISLLLWLLMNFRHVFHSFSSSVVKFKYRHFDFYGIGSFKHVSTPVVDQSTFPKRNIAEKRQKKNETKCFGTKNL